MRGGIGGMTRSTFKGIQRTVPNIFGLVGQLLLLPVTWIPGPVGTWAINQSKLITDSIREHDKAHTAAIAYEREQNAKQAGEEKNINQEGLHKAKETKIETDKINAQQKKAHHTTTQQLNAALTVETEQAKTAADSAKNQANTTTQAIKALNAAEKEVNQAYLELQKAVNALDAEKVKHDAQIDHIQDVHTALLDIIVAEEKLKAKLEVREMDHVSALKQSDAKNTANLEASRRQQTSDLHQRDEKLQTKIEMGSTQHKSDLAQDYDKKLAKRNHQLEDLLAKQSVETLDKISHMTTLEKEKQQKALIQELDEDDFEAIDQCQAHIKHLKDFIATIATTKGVMKTEDDAMKEVLAESQKVIPPNNNTSVISSVSIDGAKHSDVLSVPVTQQQKDKANARLQELKTNNTLVLGPDGQQIGVISDNKASVTEAKQTTAAQWGKGEPYQTSSELLEKEARHSASIRVGT